ncbi:MAG TPA: alpha/beta hydrolase [Saprospiraceae bacterium]|nr:alpha/beta hydrolase [Saprospiraceae bacterium]
MDNILNKNWIIESKIITSNFQEQGDKLLILLPGYSISAKWALKHYSALIKNSTAYAINWPGFNGSDLIGNKFSINMLQELITQILKHHNEKTFQLIGHSFGARIAILYAAQYPGQIEKLSLIAPVSSINPMENILSLLPTSFINYMVRKWITGIGLNRISRFLNSLGLLKKTDQDFILNSLKDEKSLSILQYYAVSLPSLQLSGSQIKEVFSIIWEVHLYLAKNDPHSSYTFWNKIASKQDAVQVHQLNGGHFGRILD